MPRFRIPDTLVGGTLGAGAGAGVYGLRHAMTPEKDREKWEKNHSLVQHLLGGAATGAVAGNIVGDRGRRYISNNLIPFDYASQENTFKPRSLAQVNRTLIQDLPANDLPGDFGLMFTQHSELARRELLRRALGVHTNKPATDYFREIGKHPFEPTELSGGIKGNYDTVEFNPPRLKDLYQATSSDMLGNGPFADSHTLPDWQDNGYTNFLAALLSRHKVRPEHKNTSNLEASDLWDFAPDAVDKHLWRDTLSQAKTRGLSTLHDRVNTDDAEYLRNQQNGAPLSPGSTERKTWLKSLISRIVLDKLIHKPLGFRQRFKLKPLLEGQGDLSPEDYIPVYNDQT